MLARRNQPSPQQKPVGPLQINRRHKFANGLAVCIVAPYRHDLVRDAPLDFVGAVSYGADFGGSYTATGAGNRIALPLPQSFMGAADALDLIFSLRWRGRWRQLTSFQRVLEYRGGALTSAFHCARAGVGANRLQFRVFYDGGNVQHGYSIEDTGENKFLDFLWVWDGSAAAADRLRGYLHGTLAATQTSSNANPGTGGNTFMLNANVGGTAAGDTDYESVMLWEDRLFSAAEAMELYQEPWQMLEPVQRRVWVPGVVGGTPEFPVALLTRRRPNTLLRM